MRPSRTCHAEFISASLTLSLCENGRVDFSLPMEQRAGRLKKDAKILRL
ncbi:hypothetical protein J6E39_01100 [bacterium]|nr:hypothetical protein [bacterium]